MQVGESLYVPLAVVSGVGFSLLAVAYRLGQSRGVAPLHVIVTVCLMGSAYYAFRAAHQPWAQTPASVVAAGLGVGATQWTVAMLIRPALRMGPLSALGCVLSLGFLPAIVYAWWAFGETVAPLQLAAFPLALGCIAAASLTGKAEPSPEKKAGKAGTCALYGLILMLLFLINALPFVAIKELGSRLYCQQPRQTYMERFGDVYFLLFYATLGAFAFSHLLLRRQKPASLATAAALGLLGGVGSIVGIAGLQACSAGPAATVITLNNVSTVVGTAVAAAVLFREGKSVGWYLTVACGVLAVVFTRLDQMLK